MNRAERKARRAQASRQEGRILSAFDAVRTKTITKAMKEYLLTFQRPGQEVRTMRVLLDAKQEATAINNQGRTDINGIKLISAEPLEVRPAEDIRKAAEMHPIFKQILKPWMP